MATSALSAIRENLEPVLRSENPEDRIAARELLAGLVAFVKTARDAGMDDETIDGVIGEIAKEAKELEKLAVRALVVAKGVEKVRRTAGAMLFVDVLRGLTEARRTKVGEVMKQFRAGKLFVPGKGGRNRRVRDRAHALLIAKERASQIGESAGVELEVPITKTKDELRVAYGWASVTKIGGKPVVDVQNDVIELPVLVRAVHDFMVESRVGGLMHLYKAGRPAAIRKNARDREPITIGTVVESIIVDDDFKKAVGAKTDLEGWYIGVKVHEDQVWDMVKSGELSAFSIGGHGKRVPAEIEE